MTQRWLAAALVAAAIAMWPACSQEEPSKGTDAPKKPNAPEKVGEAAEKLGEQPSEKANLAFTVKDMAGQRVRLSDFKGRPMLINFWATWCGPCKAEIPVFVDLVEKYKDKQFVVLGVSIDDTPDLLKKFAPHYKVNYPLLVGLGHDDLLEAYDAAIAVPVSWLIRRDGTVAAKKSGTASREWFETQVQALF